MKDEKEFIHQEIVKDDLKQSKQHDFGTLYERERFKTDAAAYFFLPRRSCD